MEQKKKRGGDTNILKRAGQAGSRGGFLKRGAVEPPYELWPGIHNNS